MSNVWKIHALYVIGILIAVIILLLTVKWTTVPNLIGYLNFASTLTSLVLALLAIVYAFLSNASISQHTAALRTTASDVTLAATGLSTVARNLEEQIGALPALWEDVGTKVTETRDLVKESLRASAPDTSAKPTPVKAVPEATISRVLKTSSLYGLMTLYAAQVAAQRKAAFELNKLCEATNLNHHYSMGWLWASHATGLLTVNVNNDIWNVIQFADAFGDELRKTAIEREKTVNAEMNVTKDTVASIEAYFSHASAETK